MLVGPDGTAVGSVSGGCVEAAVYELCQEALATGEPTRQKYGVSDDDAFAVGLTCGGTIELFVERIDARAFPELDRVAAAIESGSPVAVATVIDGPHTGARLVVWPANGAGRGREASSEPARSDAREGTLGSERIDDAVADDARGLLAAGRTGTLHYGRDGERRGEGLSVFVASYAPPPRMIVFGAIDFAAAVARIGAFLGYRVTVCDARPVFATAKRFPGADEVVVEWPHRYLKHEVDSGRVDGRTVVCVLTHDPKFDVPVLEVALAQPLGYVGAMGSRRTHEDRLARLREAGIGEEALKRLASPIGLDLGARTPEETAVSIAAEIIAQHWGGGGGPLSEMSGRIHHQPAQFDEKAGSLDASRPRPAPFEK
jgi:xanthine dehydrogenase accessory factor